VPDKQYSEQDKSALAGKQSKLSALSRRYAFVMRNTFTKAVTGGKLQHALISWAAKRNLRKSVRNPELRAKLTPDYSVGCKRLIISSTFYDAIQRENVHLETTGIERISEQGIVTVDGATKEVDVIILATGFSPFNFMRPMDLRGRNGVSIDETWAKKVQA
jgi:cation diffusion facilitator CzcD-associated flavoprotein CzcO